MVKKLLNLVLQTVLVLQGCASSTSNQPQPELIVAAAADLSSAFSEIAKSFEAETGAHIRLSFGSSGNLAKQIELGAPFDVFASANIEFVDRLAARDLIAPNTRRIYGEGRICIWQRKDNPIHIETLADLARQDVRRIAIANPEHAPYGAAAIEALRGAGVYDQVKSKLVFAENVAQARQYVESGDTDAGIIARSISDHPNGRWTLIDSSLHRPIKQAICITRLTKNEELARRFLDFVTGPQGRSVLKQYGFTLPDEQ
jgi:molybdate transport system substrate-binding protein